MKGWIRSLIASRVRYKYSGVFNEYIQFIESNSRMIYPNRCYSNRSLPANRVNSLPFPLHPRGSLGIAAVAVERKSSWPKSPSL